MEEGKIKEGRKNRNGHSPAVRSCCCCLVLCSILKKETSERLKGKGKGGGKEGKSRRDGCLLSLLSLSLSSPRKLQMLERRDAGRKRVGNAAT